MDIINNQLKKFIVISGCILCIYALFYFTTYNLEASVTGPESLLAPEYDVWCEGPPRNCGSEVIITGEKL